VLEYSDLASSLLKKTQEAGIKFRNTPLKPEIEKDGDYERNEKWKIIINDEIEIDE